MRKLLSVCDHGLRLKSPQRKKIPFRLVYFPVLRVGVGEAECQIRQLINLEAFGLDRVRSYSSYRRRGHWIVSS